MKTIENIKIKFNSLFFGQSAHYFGFFDTNQSVENVTLVLTSSEIRLKIEQSKNESYVLFSDGHAFDLNSEPSEDGTRFPLSPKDTLKIIEKINFYIEKSQKHSYVIHGDTAYDPSIEKGYNGVKVPRIFQNMGVKPLDPIPASNPSQNANSKGLRR